jgi:hypothetical protein
MVSGTRSWRWQRGQFKITSAIEDQPVTVRDARVTPHFRR